jgi:hypothetical protein
MNAESYKKLKKSLENENPSMGKHVILPSTFIGGPRSMSQLYQDLMAICRKYGPPSLFITMTTNPEWPEILANIPPGGVAYNHLTIVARVFQLKLKQLLHQLINMKQLGTVVAFVYTIQFEKRGLPHVHLMVTLEPKD